MTSTKNLTLPRLLGRREIKALLEDFARLFPGIGLAVIRADGRPFVSAGEWPQDGLDEIAGEWGTGEWTNSRDKDQPYRAGDLDYYPLQAESVSVGALVLLGDGSELKGALGKALHHSLKLLIAQAMEKRSLAQEALDRYREINLLYRIGQTIDVSLDLKGISELILEESTRIIHADVGMVLLPSSEEGKVWEMVKDFGSEDHKAALNALIDGELNRFWGSSKSSIITEFPNESPLAALLWVPLMASEQFLGGIVLGRLVERGVFTAGDENLLTALAGQSALAMGVKSVKDALRRVSFFNNMTDTQLEQMVDKGELITLKEGQVIFNEGDEAECMYVIRSGKVRTYLQNEEGDEVELKVHEVGEFFGEMALLDGKPRSASASSLTDCELFTLDRESFLNRLTTSPQLISKMFTDLTSRIRETNEKYLKEELDKQMVRADMEKERHSSITQMVAGVAHEVNTPLGIINTAASLIKRELDSGGMAASAQDEKGKKSLENVLEAAELMGRNVTRAHTLIQSFKNISVGQIVDKKEKVNLSQVVSEILELFKINAKKAGLEIEVNDTLSDKDREWDGYRGHLTRLILNLLTNVERYAYPNGSGGKVEISISPHNDRKGPKFMITVRDYGSGIPAENLTQVFNPFFTTGRSKGGTGLGMAIVYNLATEALKGKIEIDSEPDKGTMVSITFPQEIPD